MESPPPPPPKQATVTLVHVEHLPDTHREREARLPEWDVWAHPCVPAAYMMVLCVCMYVCVCVVCAYVSCCKWSEVGRGRCRSIHHFPLGVVAVAGDDLLLVRVVYSTENSSSASWCRHGRPSPFPGTGRRLLVRSTPPPPWAGRRWRGPSSSLNSPFHLPALDAVANETPSPPPIAL